MIVGNKAKIRIDGECVDRGLGWFSKDGKTFYTVRKPHHYFRIFQGFGFNEGLVEDLIDRGVENVIIYYKKFNGKSWVNEHIYLIRTWDLMTKSRKYQAENFEPQLIIKKSYLDEIKNEVIK